MAKKKAQKKTSKKPVRKKHHPGGRPTKLTPEIQDEIRNVIAKGNYLETAAALVGLDSDTIRNWMRKGRREKEGPYAEFFVTIKKAMAEAEVKAIDDLKIAEQLGYWQAGSWRLERMYPAKWGKKDPHKRMIAPQKVYELINQILLDITATIKDASLRLQLAKKIDKRFTKVLTESNNESGLSLGAR